MAEKAHIPQTPAELDAGWFTETLSHRSDGARVTAVDHTRIGEGIGFVGDLYRCHFTWDRDDEALPASVVVKLPSSIHGNRALGEGLQAYEREILVYRDHAAGIGLPMPAHIHTDMDKNPAPWLGEVVRFLLERLPIRGVQWMVDKLLNLPEGAMRRYLLVIEDIDDARPAQQFEGGTLDDALAALRVLARFHARHWMSRELLDREKLIWPFSRTPKVFQAQYRRNRDEFVQRFGDVVSAELIDRIDEVNENLLHLSDQMVDAPWTVLHGDYRLDNVLFRESGEIVVVDYQLLLWGRAGWDVAYFITTALGPEHREAEDEMLSTYHDELVAAGVTGYSMADLQADCALTKDILAHRMISSGDAINTEVEGREETFIELMVGRVCGWAEV